ncbi:MAG: hypothetical protein WB443_09170, partial [Nitrososphaeraceae archaeon]
LCSLSIIKPIAKERCSISFMTPFKRNRTPSKYIYYALRLDISDLSLRKTSQRLSQFVKRNHILIWNWIQ